MKRSILPLLSTVAMSLIAAPFTQASLFVEINFSSTEGYLQSDLGGQNSWTTPAAAGTSSGVVISSGLTNPVSPVGSDQLLVMRGPVSGSETSRNELIFTETALATPFAVDIWMMRSSETSTRDSYINITSQSSLGNGAFAGFDENRFFYQKIGNDNSLTTETYLPNTWYRFHMEIDPAASGYSLTIYDQDGGVVVDTLSNLSFRGGSAVTSIDVLRLSQLGGSTRTDFYVGGVTVIPEPSSLAMGAAGIGLLGVYRAVRRRRS